MLNLREYRIGSRLIASTIGALILMCVLVAIALSSLKSISGKAEQVAQGTQAGAELAVELRTRMANIGQHVRNAIIYEEFERQQAEEKAALAQLADYGKREQLLQQLLEEAGAHELGQRLAKNRQMAEAAINKMYELIRAGNRPDVDLHFQKNFVPAMQDWSVAISDFVVLSKNRSDAALVEMAEVRGQAQTTMLLMMALAALLMIPAGLWITRLITRPLGDALNLAESVAGGNFDNSVNAEGQDETAGLLRALDKMQRDLKSQRASQVASAASAMRIKVALDVGSNSVMVADNDGLIIYCNASALSMMRNAEADIRKDLPAFRADNILGSSFDIYHRNPSHQRNLLAAISAPHRSQITVGGRTFSLVASPIRNEAGERLGTVVEWLDRTAEVAIENEVSDIITAAVAGDFSRRVDVSDKQGFFRKLTQGMNDLLDANSRALDDVGAMLNRLSQGDLTRKIDTQYQGVLGRLRDDANVTVDNLQEIIFSIKSATDAINTAAQEIASGNADLSGRTEQQASSLEETASSMEELTGTVRQNADNSRQANQLAETAQQVAERGGAVVGQVVETMSAIRQSSSKIADIIGVIDGIAFQTNILALNAAVEAARAGEQGRGFAVVATEVRNLAQRSAAAAKEIKGLISDSVDKVEVGNRLVDQAGRTMSEVVASIQRVARIMADISSASVEQSTGIDQVSLAVSQMDEVTQQNAALVEEAAAAAESLEEQARNLSQAVATFRLSGSVVIEGQSAISGLDFDAAIEAHGKWKKRLLDYVDGGNEQLDPAIVGRDDQCALGCWIHGDGRSLRGNAQYGDLKIEHAGFHRCAADVIRTHMTGDSAGAREQIDGEFSNRSKRVIGLIEVMRSGKKKAEPVRLTANVRPVQKLTSGQVPVARLTAPDDDEWAEF